MDSNVIAVFSFFIICGIMSCCMALPESDNENNTKISIPICAKYQAVLQVRSQFLEDAEYSFKLEHTFPNKDKMLEDLKNNASVYSDAITPDCMSKIKNLTASSTNVHTATWLHFLAFSNGPLANGLRNKLLEGKIFVFGFCALVGKIFNDISGDVYYGPVPDLNPEVLQEGLKSYDIKDYLSLESAKVLIEIGNMTTVHRDRNRSLETY